MTDTPVIVAVAQAFKGSLALDEVAVALGQGVRAAGGQPTTVLGSDGGDGLLAALGSQLEARTDYQATDPLGRTVRVPVGWLDAATAVVESRLVCGLSLLAQGERDPLRTSTRGLGTVIARAVEDGARDVIVGLGGSATVDGGLGMARAWGWVPYDAAGEILPEGGGALCHLVRLEPGRSPQARLIGLCDVRTPLLGPEGAAPVFAPQKGASADAVGLLAAGLARLATVTSAAGGANVAANPGAGAAGGLGWGLMVFGGGTLEAGATWVLDRAGFAGVLDAAAAVVVAEGAFDATSLSGKLTGEVIRRAQAAARPVAVVTPRASHVPPGVVVASGDGWWTAEDLERRTAEGVRRLIRLLPR